MNEEKKMYRKLTILIAGGGTGGHLFPGIAIAEEFFRKNDETEVYFIGTNHGIEKKVLPKEELNFIPITAYGIFGKSVFDKIKGGLGLCVGVFESMRVIFSRKPDLVVGVGGYASAPMIVAGLLCGTPVVIQEQNSIPGMVNRLFGRFCRKIFLSFGKTKEFFKASDKVVLTGNPTRKSKGASEDATGKRFMESDKIKILVFGGSLGAHAINGLMTKAASLLPKEAVTVLHQTGEKDFDAVFNGYRETGVEAEVHPFIDRLYRFYDKADLVVCRAGATTIAELAAYGKASILIPFPFAVKNHQELNARELEKIGAAKVLIEKETTPEILAKTIQELIENKEALKKMGEQARTLIKSDPAETIVEECYELVGNNG